jgi:methylglyoxal synthase
MQETPVKNKERIAIIACPSMKKKRESQFFAFLDRVLPFWATTKPILHVTRSTYFALAGTGFMEYYEGVIGGEITFFADIHDNGISTIASKVADQEIDAVYQFTATEEQYKFISENYMLRRQCIIYKKPLLINTGAYIWEIFRWVASQGCDNSHFVRPEDMKRLIRSIPETHCDQFLFQKQVFSLIAHNRMKDEILAFVEKNSKIINRFGEILATKTTGTLLNTRGTGINTVKVYCSGPEGGDAQMIEGTHGKTGFIVFLQDPWHTHPHQADVESCVKAICKPESKLSIFHDSATAMNILENMKTFMKQSGIKDMRPVLVSEALETILNIKIVISDKNGEDGWKDLISRTAWYFLKSIMYKQEKNGHVSVAVPWGSLSLEIAEALKVCRQEVNKYRDKSCISSKGNRTDLNVETLDDGTVNLPDEYLHKMKIPGALFLPMTGTIGYTDHGMDVNFNARRFAELLGGRSSEIASFAFVDKTFLDNNKPYLENIEEQWEGLDYALFFCRNMQSKEDNPLTNLAIHHEMKGTDAEGEICGGIYLKSDGKEVFSEKYQRIGVSLRQLRRVKEGSFFIVADPRLINIARAALLSGVVTHLFTTQEIAIALLESELKRLGNN